MKLVIYSLFVLASGFSHKLVQDQHQTERIVGGREVLPKYKYPWMVALLYFNEANCGGTLYKHNTVITAAHCMIGSEEDWQASFHRHFIIQPIAKDNGTNISIQSWIPHPNFNNVTFNFDASVWKLNLPSSNYSPVVLNPSDNFKPGFKLNIVGWGATSYKGNGSSVLLESQVPIFNLSQCKSAYPSLNVTSQFCAGFQNGTVDACQGDSGGPIFHKSKSKVILVGIVSWGQNCAQPQHPGVYTSIAAIYDFINFHT